MEPIQPAGAHSALLILAVLLDPLQKLIAIAKLTFMEMPKLADIASRARLALMVVPLLLKHQMIPLSLRIAHAQPTPMETVAHAQLALLILSHLLDLFCLQPAFLQL
jgi:hypothetical protein